MLCVTCGQWCHSNHLWGGVRPAFVLMLLAVQPSDTGLNPASKSSQPQKWQHWDCPLCLSCRPNKARHPTVHLAIPCVGPFWEQPLSFSPRCLQKRLGISSCVLEMFQSYWFSSLKLVFPPWRWRYWRLVSKLKSKNTLRINTGHSVLSSSWFFFLKMWNTANCKEALLSFWSCSDSISSLVASVRLSGCDPRWCVHVSDMLECHRLLLLGFVVGEKPTWVCGSSSHLARTPTWKQSCCCVSLYISLEATSNIFPTRKPLCSYIFLLSSQI